MEEEDAEMVPLEQNSTVKSTPKFKDRYTFICSTRWRIVGLLFFCYILLYLHRVNLSLAVVCMVDMDQREINESPNTTNNIAIDILHMLTNGSTQSSITDDGYASGGVHTIEYSKLYTGSGFNQTNSNGKCVATGSAGHMNWTPELHWKKSHVSFLLSSYFYGSFFTQIPAGTLADRFGGKHIMTTAMIVTAVCSLLTPLCARTGIGWMFALRIVLGLAGGAVLPVGTSMINVWAPVHELPIMITLLVMGLLLGAILAYTTSGVLCEYGFDNGWPSIFYIHGGVTVIFTCLWILEAYNKPKLHPRISKAELEFIRDSKTHFSSHRPKSTPWKKILTSAPFWAICTAHFCYNWLFFTVLINIPLFMKEVLKYDAKSNGVFSALPYMFQIVSGLVFSKLAIVLIQKDVLGHLAIRRIFNSVAMIGCAMCLVGTGYVTCETRHVAVALLCLTAVLEGFIYGGFIVNHPEVGGQYAGTIFGITNAGGVISSLLASMLAGLLTPNGLQEEWQRMFYLAAGISVGGAIVFFVFADVCIQDWAKPSSTISDNGRELESINSITIIVDPSVETATDEKEMSLELDNVK